METRSVTFSMWTLGSGSPISQLMPSPPASVQLSGRYYFKVIKIIVHEGFCK